MKDVKALCDQVRQTAYDFHVYHGHGHLEKVYENALAHRLRKAGLSERATFQQAHRQWVGEALTGEMAVRDDRWSEAIAVGSLPFVDKVKSELRAEALHREVAQVGETYTLREQSEIYGGDFASENDALMPDNTIPWEKNAEYTET